jgi:hypothetical protein
VDDTAGFSIIHGKREFSDSTGVDVHSGGGHEIRNGGTVGEAEKALKHLLRDKTLACVLGRRARATIKERFRSELFVERWNTLFRRAIYEYRRGAAFRGWKPFDIASKSGEERPMAEFFSSGAFNYCRVGFDNRRMTFLRDGRVGEGAAGCEVFWDVKAGERGELCLEISSGYAVTCRLKRASDGSWRGRWGHHEKMPIVLSSVQDLADKAGTKESNRSR